MIKIQDEDKITYEINSLYIQKPGSDDLSISSTEHYFIPGSRWFISISKTGYSKEIVVKGLKILEYKDHDIDYDNPRYMVKVDTYDDYQIIKFTKLDNTLEDKMINYRCYITNHEYNPGDIIQFNNMIHDPAYSYVNLSFNHVIKKISVESEHEVCELIADNIVLPCTITRVSANLQEITFPKNINDILTEHLRYYNIITSPI